MKEKIITTIDIGTNKIGASIGKMVEGEVDIIGSEVVASRGVEKGLVKNPKACREAIIELLSNVENKYKINLEDIYVGISNVGLRIIESWGTVNLREGKISNNDLKRAINKGRLNINLHPDEEILDVIINYYKVDGKVTTEEVNGWIGSTLELNLTMVIAKESLIDTYRSVFDGTRYFVKGFLSNTISCRNVFFTKKSMVGTRTIVDCGAGITEIAVFKNGIIKYLDTVPLGGNSITKDLSICGEFAFNEAEGLKVITAPMYKSILKDENEEKNLKVGTSQIEKKLFYEVTNARIEEIIKYIGDGLKKCSHFDDICSIIIYGEALSYFENIDNTFKAYINKKIQFVTKEKLGISSNTKVVSLALLKEALDRQKIFSETKIPDLHKESKVNSEIKVDEEVEEIGLVGKLKNFLHEIF